MSSKNSLINLIKNTQNPGTNWSNSSVLWDQLPKQRSHDLKLACPYLKNIVIKGKSALAMKRKIIVEYWLKFKGSCIGREAKSNPKLPPKMSKKNLVKNTLNSMTNCSSFSGLWLNFPKPRRPDLKLSCPYFENIMIKKKTPRYLFITTHHSLISN